MVAALGAVVAAGIVVPLVVAAGADVTLSPGSLTFADRAVGTTADALAVQLSNTGDSPLKISTIHITGRDAGDFAHGSACPISPDAIPVGGSCTIYVSFTPHGSGAKAASLEIGDDAASSPQSVALSGGGLASPQVQLTPTTLTFGATEAGDEAAAQTVRLTNTGGATLHLSAIRFSGTNAADFTRTTTCDLAAGLAAGVSCTVDVVFAPKEPGEKTGTLAFDDNAPGSPQSVTVAGTATAAPGPSASLSPSSLTFPSEAVGSPAAPQTVALANTGQSAMSIGAISVVGANAGDFAETNDCPASLASNATCSVSVTFTPVKAGTRIGSLAVNDDAPGSPQVIGLSGVGASAGLYLADGFESGLGQWDTLSSSDSSIAVDSSVANSGSTSVRFTNNSNDQSSRLMADLAGGGHAQSYTRWCFRIAPGQTEGMEIANGRAITAEYPLGIRRFVIDYNPATKGLEGYFFNENLDRLDMSAAVGRVLTGRWYCAELYLDESANGHAQLWLDGVSVGSVSGDLSTPGLYSRFYLWNQAGAGTVWFDDVEVADAPIGAVGAGADPLPGPQAAVSPGSVSFGSQPAHTTSSASTVTLSNTGHSPLTVAGVTISGPNAADFSETNDCPATLAAGASCSAWVAFRPSAIGARNAALVFADDAADAPQSVTLSGTGEAVDEATATLSRTALSFGEQTVGTHATAQTVTLTNTGTLPMSIAAVTITGGNASEFAQSSDCPADTARLAVGASCTIYVSMTAAGTGTRSATLSIAGNAGNSPATLALDGVGVLPPGVFLTDGFESGLGLWTKIGDGTETAQTATVKDGAAAAALTNAANGGYAGLSAGFAGQDQAQTYTSFCFELDGLAVPAVLAQGRDDNGLSLWEVDYDPGLKGLDVYFWNGARERTNLFTPSNSVTTGRWYCAEIDLDAATAGHAAISLDGHVAAGTNGDFSAADRYSRLLLWNSGAAGTVDFDDVEVASTPSGSHGSGGSGQSGPALVPGPTALAFAAQPSGTTSPAQTVTLANSGTAAVTIGGLSVTGTNSGDFAESNDCPASLAAGATCTAMVKFTPTAAGARSASLTVTDDAADSPQAVALSGNGTPAGTYLSDDFESGLGQWDPLSSSDSSIALDSGVSNSGSGSVRFTNNSNDQSSRLMADLAGGGHAQSYTRWCFRIAPGVADGVEIANGRAITAEYPLGIRRFVIDYNPATKGLEGYFFNEGLQRLDMSAATGRVLTGRWYCAELYLDESANGHARLWLDGVPVGSVDGDLSTPGTYSRLYLWNQAGAGTVWFDDVKVADAPIGPVGAGAAALPGPQASLSPSAVGFGSQTTSTTSPGQTVTLTNTGSSALTISGVAVTGANAGDFGQTNTCPGTLAAGASCTATVRFTPSAVGSRTASLSITDDASGTPHTVALSGTGAAPSAALASVSPTSILFGTQQVNTRSGSQAVTLTNTGTLPMSVSGITLGGANAADFSQTNTCPSGSSTLAVGASCTIDVTVTPAATGSRSATLSIAGNATNSPSTVTLSASGTLPPGTLLLDGFESGLGGWTSLGTPATITSPGHSGSSAALVAPGQAMYANFAAASATRTHTTFYANMGLASLGMLAQGRDANGALLWEIDGDPGIHGLDLYVWNGAGVRSDGTVPNVLVGGVWPSFDVDFDQSAAGHLSVLVFGAKGGSVTGDFRAPTSFSRLVLANPSSTSGLAFDDVSVTAP